MDIETNDDVDREVVRRIKAGEPYMCIGATVEDHQRTVDRAIRELRNENALLRQALAEAAIPLEVLHGLDNRWHHPRLAFWWGRLVSDDLRGQIKQAVTAIRETVGRL